MSGETSIEWATHSWNPTTGCDRVSPGCDHCYALTMAKRLKGMGSAHYQRDGDPKTSGPGFGLSVHPDSLDWPLRKTKPMRVFVNSMSDLFHKDVPDDFIARVFAVMAMAPLHTFMVLTKRHARMRSLLSSAGFWRQVGEHGRGIAFQRVAGRYPKAGPMALTAESSANGHWEALQPLPNVYLGVSVENQQWANVRIPALLETPAAVRFLSCEPLLGPVSLFANTKIDTGTLVDWVIVGGESGPGARPMHPMWARQLRDECTTYGIRFLFKQWGAWKPDGLFTGSAIPAGTHAFAGSPDPRFTHTLMRRGTKKTSGRVLDGRTWDEFPEMTGANA